MNISLVYEAFSTSDSTTLEELRTSSLISSTNSVLLTDFGLEAGNFWMNLRTVGINAPGIDMVLKRR
jgi:metal-dependent hydrolase (beta-lactamase superfamily II)